MPGWHAKTEQLVADKKLLVAGIAPEQHGDRMALFLQWKQMEDMPVMVDSFNILNLKVVPVTLLIDESGVIRHRNPSEQDLRTFLKRPPAEIGSAPEAEQLSAAIHGVNPTRNPAWPQNMDDYHQSFIDQRAPKRVRAAQHFQLGVAFRMRFDSKSRDSADFAIAVWHWTTALELDPSNYIWRRRLQQYGPLLDKPYPFYNWIAQARDEIETRSETPRPLVTEPGEAERALPAKRPDAANNPPPHPDPDGKLPKDEHGLTLVATAVIPHTNANKQSVRAFIEITPNAARQAKWNDEGGLSSVHIKPPQGWVAHPAVLTLAPTTKSPLTSPRRIEFEMHRDGTTGAEHPTATAEFFYHICSGTEGLCQFLRRDVSVELP